MGSHYSSEERIMTYREVLLAAAIVIGALLCTSVHAQGESDTLTATIGSKSEIITGSDWIASVSRKGDQYVITLKPNIVPKHECEASIPASEAPKGVKASDLDTLVGYPTTQSVSVETYYKGEEDDVSDPLPFKLVCKR